MTKTSVTSQTIAVENICCLSIASENFIDLFGGEPLDPSATNPVQKLQDQT